MDWSKPDFPGKAALEEERRRGPAKRCVSLVLELEETDAPYMSTLWDGDAVAGEITSSGWGYRVGASIALGMVRADLAVPGRKLEAEVFGNRHPARVHGESALWDPDNARIRA